jgi:hypothetical protein
MYDYSKETLPLQLYNDIVHIFGKNSSPFAPIIKNSGARIGEYFIINTGH